MVKLFQQILSDSLLSSFLCSSFELIFRDQGKQLSSNFVDNFILKFFSSSSNVFSDDTFVKENPNHVNQIFFE
jgi:hypothetical protein